MQEHIFAIVKANKCLLFVSRRSIMNAMKKFLNAVSGIIFPVCIAGILLKWIQTNALLTRLIPVMVIFLILYIATGGDGRYRLLPVWKRVLRLFLFPVIILCVCVAAAQVTKLFGIGTRQGINEHAALYVTLRSGESLSLPAFWLILPLILAVLLVLLYVRMFNPVANISQKKLDNMAGIEFEQYCAKVLRKNGYRKIRITQGSSDYGADIIARKLGRKWVIQCKRYNRVVGSDPVQEVVAAMSYYHAKRAAVMTNVTFTANAKRLAKANDVMLIDGEALRQMSRR